MVSNNLTNDHVWGSLNNTQHLSALIINKGPVAYYPLMTSDIVLVKFLKMLLITLCRIKTIVKIQTFYSTGKHELQTNFEFVSLYIVNSVKKIQWLHAVWLNHDMKTNK